ncbi:uncharacterized protein LOC134202149 [Armigeres subalbatus]|uniref:uncharacterized protein LOC134202149 n=1 Tax=Armigeres subalbatus TaxID=124917 RepID=UPI002ED3932E
MYKEFIHEYRRLGHMVELNYEEEGGPQYYIPHHCILKPDSTTTKLRVVFDASCATTSGVSLNNALMVGPTVQDDLLSIVTRFRWNQYAIVADVEKMYRMVLVQPSDRRLQRIFWRDSPTDPIRIYELCTVTYGTASAPYLATKCLSRLAELDGDRYPAAAKMLVKDFYVDDMLSGVDSIEEGITLCADVQELLRGGGFTLRKWSSNCPEILEQIPPEYRDERTSFELDGSSAVIKTLGLVWEPQSDFFNFKAPEWNESPITKCVAVSDLARIFDPSGLIGPVIVAGKIFIQHLWKIKISWYEELAADLQQQWREYRSCLEGLKELQIPRWIGFRKELKSVELHGFCDASTKAYGACIYIRCIGMER